MIKAVIFDLDGTLVNSIEDLAASANYALDLLGFPTHETEKYRYFVGDGMMMLVKRILPEDKRDNETIEECHRIFRSHYDKHYLDKTAEYGGITDMLSALRKGNKKIAVVSNKADIMAKTVVRDIFGDIFDAVTGKSEDYPLKPDPALTLKIIEELGVNPGECAFVGDSGMDMKTAVRAGALPIGVLWGFREREELIQNGAVHIIDEPNCIVDLLEDKYAGL